MGDAIVQLTSLLRGVWKYRWSGVLVAWVVGAIGAAVVLWVPDKFEASARIYVDTQSILKPLMSGLAVQPNVEQQVTMLSRTLISRPNVEKLIRMADLDLGQKTKEAQEKFADALGELVFTKEGWKQLGEKKMEKLCLMMGDCPALRSAAAAAGCK